MIGGLAPKVVRVAVLAAMLARLIPAHAQTLPQRVEPRAPSSGRFRETFSISGTVLDPSGAVVVGASVFMRSQRGDIPQSTQSDSAGGFRFRGLSEGRYVIRIEQAGFKPYETRLRLRGDSERHLLIVLAIANLEEKITVDSSEGHVSADVSENIDAVRLDSQKLEGLPILGQDVVSAISQLLGPASIGTGGATVVVDGMPGAEPGLPASAIQEVKISNNPYSAEFARPGKGRIEIITKSGSSSYHGSFYFGLRDYRLDGRNALAVERPPEQRRQFEGYLSGPIGTGKKTTFLLTASRKDDRLQSVIYAVAPEGPVRQNFPTPQQSTYLSAQLTRQVAKNPLTFRYTVFDWSARGLGVGGVTLPEAASDSASRLHQVNSSYRATPTTKLLNEFSLRARWEDASTRSQRPGLPRIVVEEAFVGGGAEAERRETDTRVELTDVVSWSGGKHFIKTGINLPALSRRGSNERSNFDGTFYFSSLDDFARRTPFSFVQQQGNGHLVFWHKELGVFMQDDVRIRQDLSVAVGLRYDWQNYLSDYSNFAPRLSLAFAPGKERKTVLRVGTGIFYDMTGPQPIADTLRFNGRGLRQLVFSNPGYPDPLSSSGSFSTLPASLVRFAPTVRSPYILQYSVGIERQLQKSLTLSVTYEGTRGARMFRSRDVNAPLPPLYLARPDTSVGRLRQIESSGQLKSHALETTLRGNLTRFFNGMVVYALRRAYNDTDGISSFPANNYDLSGEWSRARFDARHFLYLYGILDAGKFFQVGVVFSANSGRPYGITTGRDDNHDGFANDRPPGVRRNSMQGPGSATLDLRWSRTLFGQTRKKNETGPNATIGVDAFNILNRVNFGSPVGNLSSPFFGRSISAGSARRLQVWMNFKF
jgi:hypothetical protein